ncbi:nitrogenase component 1 [Vibrio sp. kj40-1]|uniref:Nitrogenase component 1 n=1 Tax=Vibrio algarum TaxID=3020714 RepID=A0ABT4YRI8_9VIBR|nr:nitrogenase component 1 [Vibrio sp. KJ40-1]
MLYTGGVKSWSVISALSELGVETIATGTKKSTQSDKNRIVEIMGKDAVMLDEGGARLLLDTYYRSNADVMIAGGRNMYTALKARLPFLDINQEREHAYAGYEGMITMAKELCRTIESPIWSAVNSNAPWNKDRN